MTDDDHVHAHEGHDHSHAPHPVREDEDTALTYDEARFLALKALLIEKGVITADAIRARMEINEQGNPQLVSRFRSSPNLAADLMRTSESKGH
jgi:nitrile hydratase